MEGLTIKSKLFDYTMPCSLSLGVAVLEYIASSPLGQIAEFFAVCEVFYIVPHAQIYRVRSLISPPRKNNF